MTLGLGLRYTGLERLDVVVGELAQHYLSWVWCEGLTLG